MYIIAICSGSFLKSPVLAGVAVG